MTHFNILISFLLIMPGYIHSQASDTYQKVLQSGRADLNTCIEYALEHNPIIEQLRLRDRITRQTIASELSGWLPQVDLNANYQHYLRQPVSIFPDFNNPEGPKRVVTTGVANTSSIQLGASQSIYSPDLIIAGTSAKLYKRQVFQSNQEQLIDLILKISKAFYNVLLTEERLNLFMEDRLRIDRSFKDAYSLYESGLNDKIDYQRAQISLNNIDAEIAGTREDIKASYASLKDLMGYPHKSDLVIQRDSNIAEKALLDTSLMVRSGDRVEYQLLSTNLMIQHANVNYRRLQFLPTLTAFANYNLVYQNDNFEALYDRDFPNSAAGLRLALPIFEGGRKLSQLKIARLRLDELRYDSVILSSRINMEFETAMASYKSNLKALDAARKNTEIAAGIYNTVTLQYNQGIKGFLEVIVSEADLRTARINEINALYRLIASKLDVDASLGRIQVNY